VNFIDLQEQFRRYEPEIMREIREVIASARFIMGPAVTDLEKTLAAHTGVAHAIGCSSGTDALLLALLALGVKPGDEVIVPDFTFFATAEVVSFLGAVPVFADVDEKTYNIDVGRMARHITKRTRGIIPVSLFGQCADLDEVNQLAQAHGLWVIEDAAQSYGAVSKGRKSGSITRISATSFYPAKPLGCYGDGGAVFTSDERLARDIRELIDHGQSERYKHSRVGMNGRLDTLQAAVLKVKLRHFDDEMAAKRTLAEAYCRRLAGHVVTPTVLDQNVSVWAQFTVRSPQRERILERLKDKHIPTAIHYPIPLHRQEVFAGMRVPDRDYPVSNKVSSEVFSLPMHPFLTENEVETVCTEIIGALA
jgi:UDP-2-acetamido-2-deoxy-ribo-hexuluronate aminotransferase